MLVTKDPIEAFLAPSEAIDFPHPAIQSLARRIEREAGSDVERARAAFGFVRDAIAHSADIKSSRITRRASEVLEYREGICYAKSLLLAGLLRAMKIPSGIAYQRLVLGETPESGYCIHALNTVYFRDLGRWLRLDARGNKPGVDAQFSLEEEKLAFAIQPALDECDYWTNYPEPHPVVTDTLRRNSDGRWMYHHDLPQRLPG